jgi:hypothetical protein
MCEAASFRNLFGACASSSSIEDAYSEIGIAYVTAKVHYGTSLSNVDWLHGGAESLLTLTNLFIVFGLRNALQKPAKSEDDDAAAEEEEEGIPLSK